MTTKAQARMMATLITIRADGRHGYSMLRLQQGLLTSSLLLLLLVLLLSLLLLSSLAMLLDDDDVLDV